MNHSKAPLFPQRAQMGIVILLIPTVVMYSPLGISRFVLQVIFELEYIGIHEFNILHGS